MSVDEQDHHPLDVVSAQHDQQKLTSKNRNRKNKQRSSPKPSTLPPAATPSYASQPMKPRGTIPLLICSVGNPGRAYANTLHSAGHTVLNRLAELEEYGSFQQDRSLGNGLVSTSRHTLWTLWQSTAYMNESGKDVKAAWKKWINSTPDGQGRLVIVHDELEKPLGTVTLGTNPGASAKGHNGLKSIKSAMSGDPYAPTFARIGIGIGRPVSRESDDVARYVLRKMTAVERGLIEASVHTVLFKLQQLDKE